MTDPAKLKLHAALLDQMAATVAVDLEEALFAGDLSMDELSDSVLRCVDCASAAHCTRWLAAAEMPVAAPPGFCRNRELLQRLQAGEGR